MVNVTQSYPSIVRTTFLYFLTDWTVTGDRISGILNISYRKNGQNVQPDFVDSSYVDACTWPHIVF